MNTSMHDYGNVLMNIILNSNAYNEYHMVLNLEYVTSASITKERGSNTWYMLQINVSHLRISYVFKVHHSYAKKFCHHKKGKDC